MLSKATSKAFLRKTSSRNGYCVPWSDETETANMSEFTRKLYFRVAFFAFLLPLALGDCIYLDLGMESGSIPDSNITASSTQSAASTPAKNGRLNFASGSSWCAATSDTNPYLQIDLQTLHIICAVSTQGNSKADQWAANYTLQSSIDGSSWKDYTEIGQVKTLKGNSDRNSEVKHILYEGVLARYLRFLPETNHGGVCMRTEVFGVKQKPENLALAKPTAQSSTVTNSNIGTAESGRAVDGNPDTEMTNRHCSLTQQNNPSWWRVDLGSDHVPVSEIHIANRFSTRTDVQQRSKDYKITLENLAFGKQTSQISTDHGGVSSRAVDGNSETHWNSGSCTHTRLAYKPWWRVDLGQVEPVSEVYIVNRGDGWTYKLSNFEIRVGSTTSGGGVTNPKCGGTYRVPGGKGLSFFCRPPLHGRYVTIRSLRSDSLTICEVEVYSERKACQMQALGVSSRDAFPDNSFSALTSSSSNEASKGRLNGVGAWSPSTDNDASDFLQIELKYEFFICAVATQGKSNADHWTTKYKLLLSLNNVDWVTYQENSIDKVFNGNSGKNDIVKHNLKEITRARFIRFQPITYSTRKALRVEVFGILKPAAPSQAPSSFAVFPLSSTSVKATWQLPPVGSRHGIITGFKLLYRKKSSAADSLTILTIENNSTLRRDVTGLRKYTEYEFQVLAFSYAGNGPTSSVQLVITHQDVPSKPPSMVTVTVSSSSRITVSWQLPPKDFRHGIITGFKLFYKITGSAESPSILPVNSGAIRTRDVTGLKKYTGYEFQLLAFTSVGDGPKSSVAVVRTMEDAPSAPFLGYIHITPSKSHGPRINLTWSQPAEANGIIRSYTVIYSHEGDTQQETFGSDVLSHIDDVLGGVTYQFHVQAVTIKPGPNASLTVTIPEYTPSAPLLSHTNILPSKSHGPRINLTWSKPTEANGIIRNFTVFYSHEGVTQKETFGSDTLSYIVDVLGGVTYQFHVRAVTIKPGPNASLTVTIPAYVTLHGKTVKKISGVAVKNEFKLALLESLLGKPVAKDLPERTMFAVGELAILTCEVSGYPEPSVTWNKDGDTIIPRAQFRYNGQILVIEDVLPLDSGVYECKASNKLGESRTSTTLIVGVPPIIIKDISPPSDICEKQTLCLLSCYASSESPCHYSWTKNGQVPDSDNIKVVNNSLVLTPRDVTDYGVYVCNATNSFGSTTYNITLSECHKSSTGADTIKEDENVNGIFNAMISTLSCIVFVLLVVNGLLIWRLRRAVPNSRTTTEDKAVTDDIGQPDLPRDQHVSEPGSYMELRPRPSEVHSRVPSEYTSLQEANNNPGYYNVGGNGHELDLSRDQQLYMEVYPRPSKEQSRELPEYKNLQGTKDNPRYYNVEFNKGNSGNKHEEIFDEIYDEIGNAQS
ncbi:hypothetical protein ACROYT_G043237 [Oculina patagonica]